MLWKWKLARDCDEVLHLLNGETRYDHPVPDARVCMTWRGDHPRFWVFATKASRAREPHAGSAGWSWRMVADADDALTILRGEDPAVGPVAQAQIAAAWTGRDRRFYVFYRLPSPGEAAASADDWAWTLADDKDDAIAILNGGSSAQPLATARVATAHRDHHDDFYIFFRRDDRLGPVEPWQWQTVATADEVRSAVDGKGRSPLEFQVVGPPGGHGTFQLFTNPGLQAGTSSAPNGAGVLTH
jgi:hypothetical protein